MFDIKIGANQAFDYKDQPFKLEFNWIEPEQSHNSPFDIEPRNCVIPSKQTLEFSVIFNSDQGINKYPAVILAHPKLAEQEIDPDDEEMLALATWPLGIVALKLLAETIAPVLTVDRKERLDSEF